MDELEPADNFSAGLAKYFKEGGDLQTLADSMELVFTRETDRSFRSIKEIPRILNTKLFPDEIVRKYPLDLKIYSQIVSGVPQGFRDIDADYFSLNNATEVDEESSIRNDVSSYGGINFRFNSQRKNVGEIIQKIPEKAVCYENTRGEFEKKFNLEEKPKKDLEDLSSGQRKVDKEALDEMEGYLKEKSLPIEEFFRYRAEQERKWTGGEHPTDFYENTGFYYIEKGDNKFREVVQKNLVSLNDAFVDFSMQTVLAIGTDAFGAIDSLFTSDMGKLEGEELKKNMNYLTYLRLNAISHASKFLAQEAGVLSFYRKNEKISGIMKNKFKNYLDKIINLNVKPVEDDRLNLMQLRTQRVLQNIGNSCLRVVQAQNDFADEMENRELVQENLTQMTGYLEKVEKGVDVLNSNINGLAENVNRGFASVNRNISDMHVDIAKRVDNVDSRVMGVGMKVDTLEKKIDSMGDGISQIMKEMGLD